MAKVHAEMAQAVHKHGKVELPNSHIEEFYERINQEKKNIVTRA